MVVDLHRAVEPRLVLALAERRIAEPREVVAHPLAVGVRDVGVAQRRRVVDVERLHVLRHAGRALRVEIPLHDAGGVGARHADLHDVDGNLRQAELVLGVAQIAHRAGDVAFGDHGDRRRGSRRRRGRVVERLHVLGVERRRALAGRGRRREARRVRARQVRAHRHLRRVRQPEHRAHDVAERRRHERGLRVDVDRRAAELERLERRVERFRDLRRGAVGADELRARLHVGEALALQVGHDRLHFARRRPELRGELRLAISSGAPRSATRAGLRCAGSARRARSSASTERARRDRRRSRSSRRASPSPPSPAGATIDVLRGAAVRGGAGAAGGRRWLITPPPEHDAVAKPVVRASARRRFIVIVPYCSAALRRATSMLPEARGVVVLGKRGVQAVGALQHVVERPDQFGRRRSRDLLRRAAREDAVQQRRCEAERVGVLALHARVHACCHRRREARAAGDVLRAALVQQRARLERGVVRDVGHAAEACSRPASCRRAASATPRPASTRTGSARRRPTATPVRPDTCRRRC